MKKRYLLLSVLFSLIISAPVLACKMTLTGSNSAAIQAILQHFTEKEHDSEIKAIRKIKVKNTAWAYVVETIKEGKSCKAQGFQVSFDPSCKAKVQPLNRHFICK